MDLQRWLADHLPAGSRSGYINDLYDILRASSKERCMNLIEDKKRGWNRDFVKHFEKAVEPKLEYFCIWSIRNACPYHPVNGITTNASEGFNYLLKDFQNWKEVPVDSLVMSLKMLQGYYMEESRRGKAGLGSFTLKARYAEFTTNVDEFQSKLLVCHPRDIVSSIRNKEYKPMDDRIFNDLQTEFSSNSRIIRAKELVQSDRIVFSPRLGIFTVLDNNAYHTVRLFPSALCSCPVKKNCLHVLGVKLGLGLDINMELSENKNLGVIRKNVRQTRQKAGRKRPRQGDIDPPTVSANAMETSPVPSECSVHISPVPSEQSMEEATEQREHSTEQREHSTEQREHSTEHMEEAMEQREHSTEQMEPNYRVVLHL